MATKIDSKNYKHIHTSLNDFVSEATKWLTEHINQTISQRGHCIIGLSGGSTPGPIYEQLGTQQIDWNKVSVFLVDERYISKDHKDANTNLCRTTLLKNAKIPEENVILPDTSLPLEECIKNYGDRLKKLFNEKGKGYPDILTLGLGPDGHIASLFPPVVAAGFQKDPVVIHTTTTQFAVFDRFTITMPYITQATHQVFFMKGQDKLDVWNNMLSSEGNHERWPAHDVIATGNTTLIIAS